MNHLKREKKRLALIAPLFFGYYKDIQDEAQEMGFSVDYFCDAPSNSNISKAFARVDKRLVYRNMLHYYHEKVLPYFKKKRYDCVLVIAGMTFAFSADMVEEMRASQKSAAFVLYQWDSEKNLPYVTGIHKYFDLVYTFDRFDAAKKEFYRFLPLFYNRTYEQVGAKPVDRYEYDCMYVGTAHPKKYEDINKIAAALKPVYQRQFIYHYMPSVLKFIYHKILAPEFKGARWKNFQNKKMTSEEIIRVLEKTKCVLDAPQAGQTGLTIRTLECLGAKRKLITSNADVIHYDFYDPQNILVLEDGSEPDLKSSFFTGEYRELPEEIYNKYSIHSWLKELIGCYTA